jgi:hypothetical protein
MITSQPTPGGGTTRLIVSTPQAFGLRAKHDPWLAHAVAGFVNVAQGNNIALQKQTCGSATFTLIDGNDYVYFYGDWQQCAGAQPLIDRTYAWPVPNRTGGFVGEGFNYLLRLQPTVKIPFADLTTYLAAYGADGSSC